MYKILINECMKLRVYFGGLVSKTKGICSEKRSTPAETTHLTSFIGVQCSFSRGLSMRAKVFSIPKAIKKISRFLRLTNRSNHANM